MSTKIILIRHGLTRANIQIKYCGQTDVSLSREGVKQLKKLSKKMNKEGAIAGMLTGLCVTLFYVFAHKGLFFIQGTQYLDLIGGANSFFGITPEAFGAVGAAINFIVAIVVNKFTKKPPIHIQEMVEAVRIPRGAKEGAH